MATRRKVVAHKAVAHDEGTGSMAAELPRLLAPGVPILNQWTGMARLDVLKDHPRNPHESDDEAIADSLATNGWYGFVVVQAGTNYILAGHGRRRVAERTGATEVPTLWVECSAAVALRILAADNRIAQRGSDDPVRLAEVLESFRSEEGGFHGTGYTEADLAALQEGLAERFARAAGPDGDGEDEEDEAERARYGEREEDGAEPVPGEDRNPEDETGAYLERLNLELLVPRHTVTAGEVWRLGHPAVSERYGAPEHRLVVADVFLDWSIYVPWLYRLATEMASLARADGRNKPPRPVLSAPFAGPFDPLTIRAERHAALVLVQPDLVIAGHILDKYTEIHGAASVERLVAVDAEVGEVDMEEHSS